MSKAKCADDLAEILSARLDLLTNGKATLEDIKLSDAISRQIGRSLSLAALRISYQKHKASGGVTIQTLESRKKV